MAEISANAGDSPHPTRPPSSSSIPATASSAATPPWAGGSTGSFSANYGRSYEQIIAESSQHILIQFKLHKIINPETPNEKPDSLKPSDFGEYLFDVLKINPEACLEIDMSTGRYDTKELLVKAGTPIDDIVLSPPKHFKQHKISAQVVRTFATKVVFRNVPISVPNEEILHLCSQYGKPKDGIVHREVFHFGAKRSIPSSTRWVEMMMEPGKSFMNYYWLAGPQPGDVARRITVLHSGQTRQCSWCLRCRPTSSSATPSPGHCPGGGDGKICEDMDTPRAKLSDYIAALKEEGYISLKDLHLAEKAARCAAFPSLGAPSVSARQVSDNVVPEHGHTADEEEVVVSDQKAVPYDVPVSVSEVPVSTSEVPVSASVVPVISVTPAITAPPITSPPPAFKPPPPKSTTPKKVNSKQGLSKKDKRQKTQLEKPLIQFISEGIEVSDDAIKKYAEWAIQSGYVEQRKGHEGEFFPIMSACNDEAGKCKDKHTKVGLLEGRIHTQIQVLAKCRGTSQGAEKEGRARTFSETGFEEQKDIESALKSLRTDSPPKS